MSSLISLELYDSHSPSSSVPSSPCKVFLPPLSVSIGRGASGSKDSARSDSGTFRSDYTKSMSQKHAELTWEGNQPFIKDLGSTNGTWIEVGGQAKRALGEGERHKIVDGDVLVFGKEITGADKNLYLPLKLRAALKPQTLSATPVLSVISSEVEVLAAPTPAAPSRQEEPQLKRVSPVAPSSSARKSSGTYGVPDTIDLVESDMDESDGENVCADFLEIFEPQVDHDDENDEDEEMDEDQSEEEEEDEEEDEEIDEDEAVGYPRGTADYARDPLDRENDRILEIARARGLTAFSPSSARSGRTSDLMAFFARAHDNDSPVVHRHSDSDEEDEENEEIIDISGDEDEIDAIDEAIALSLEREQERLDAEEYALDVDDEQDEEKSQEEHEFDDADADDYNESDEEQHDSDENDDVDEVQAEVAMLDQEVADAHRDLLEQQHANRMATLALAGEESDHADDYDENEDEDEMDQDSNEFKDNEAELLLNYAVVDDEDEDDDDEMAIGAAERYPLHLGGPFVVDSDNEPPVEMSSRPSGRIPSPFIFKNRAFAAFAKEDSVVSAASTLPSPEQSPEQQPRNLQDAKRIIKAHLEMDEDNEWDDAPSPRPTGFYTRPRRSPLVYKGRKVGGRSSSGKSTPLLGRPGLGMIRRPRIVCDSDEEDEEECRSQASHLPSPSDSSREESVEAESIEQPKKRAKAESNTNSPKKSKAAHDFFDLLEELHHPEEVELDGLDEVDAEALQEVDNDDDDDAGACTAHEAIDDIFVKLESNLEKINQANDVIEQYKSSSVEVFSPAELKPLVIDLDVSSPAKSPAPVSSPSKGVKRNRDQSESRSSEEVQSVIDECVAHVAKEARDSQAEQSINTAAEPAVPLMAQADPEEVQVRPIAPLPKRATTKFKTALTFLSGMAAAVVGMECIGILAGLMEE